ncbi:MAG: alanine--tRNA ligase [Acholeplasmataceae bacterium]
MKYMTSNEIRKMWLDFFQSKKHLIISSSSLIPVDDPTLLWINSGVASLKKYFDGSLTPSNKRMTNIQKSIRTNDIDEVGKTSRHHTFFEMMGNFSIGDYFKEKALEYAYELLFSSKWFNFPKDKIYITYYPDDLEAKEIWLKLGINENHLIPNINNFWEIGVGPSGPNTEIFFDRGLEYDKRGPELIEKDIENDRYIEIWNIVFSEYNADPSLPRSKYKELPNKNIDTGAGLERFASILQNTKTNFETDLHYPIILKLVEITNIPYNGQMEYKVISDHLKTLVFAISDGATLSNEGRGYVLRRLLRRAIKHGLKLNLNKPFLYLLVDTVINMMSDFYPNLKTSEEIIKKIILREEEKFLETIIDGEKHLINSIKNNHLSGKSAFMLYDTYGFPIELTLEYALEHQVTVDLEGFNEELKLQKERSRKARSNTDSMESQDEIALSFKEKSEFIGYDTLVTEAKVIKIFNEGIVTDKTPFYATSGGQIADSGFINGVKVLNVTKLPNGQHLHHLNIDEFNLGDDVILNVDKDTRDLTEKNHTATHLLHQAIKEVIGNHSHQQGSYNGPDKLTFDINHYDNITDQDILKIEKIVKDKIKENIEVETIITSLDEAKKLNATMLFGEKYDKIVRVVKINDFSIELCGGTHVPNTGLINDFKIISVESIGSGIYRFNAITNNIKDLSKLYLKTYYETIDSLIRKINSIDEDFKVKTLKDFKNSYEDIINIRKYISELSETVKELEKDNQEKLINNILKDADKYIPSKIEPTTYIITNDLFNNSLKPLIDVLYDKIKTDVIILINLNENKATYLVKTKSLDARTIIKELNQETDGRGGGKPDLAQGGTQNLNLLNKYLKGKNII